jgi:hypothetical protein
MRLEITMRVKFARVGRHALSLIERLALRLVCVCVCATLAACATKNAPGAAKESGAAKLIVADIRVLFGETAGNACAVKLIAQAAVRVQPVGQPEEKEPRYLISAEQPQAPLEQWAAEPTFARAQLDELLAALGRKLVLSYGDRMACTERQCDWLVTTRAPTDPRNPVAE